MKWSIFDESEMFGFLWNDEYFEFDKSEVFEFP